MKPIPSLRLVLDLDPLAEPIRGRVLAARDGDARAFSGWIELSSVIEQLRAEIDITGYPGADAPEPSPDA